MDSPAATHSPSLQTPGNTPLPPVITEVYFDPIARETFIAYLNSEKDRGGADLAKFIFLIDDIYLQL